jgi:hypothetical protein
MSKQPALRLVKTWRGCAIAERTPRYEVFLFGKLVERLWFNTRGYVGYLPTPDGNIFSPGECSITAYRRQIATLNREYAAAVESKTLKHHAHVQFVMDGGSRLLSSGDPLPIKVKESDANQIPVPLGPSGCHPAD